jgi:hypothetical protein
MATHGPSKYRKGSDRDLLIQGCCQQAGSRVTRVPIKTKGENTMSLIYIYHNLIRDLFSNSHSFFFAMLIKSKLLNTTIETVSGSGETWFFYLL